MWGILRGIPGTFGCPEVPEIPGTFGVPLDKYEFCSKFGTLRGALQVHRVPLDVLRGTLGALRNLAYIWTNRNFVPNLGP